MPQGALAVVAIAATAASTALTISGQQQQKKAVEQQANFNAQVKRNEAVKEELESRESVRRKRIQGRRLKAQQEAKFAKSGVAIEGSPLEVLADTATNIELSVADERRASRIRQGGLKTGAELDIFQGEAESSALRTGQGATLLSGASRIASQSSNLTSAGKN